MASILKVDKLDPQSGTALEIGTSGDTITVPSGATLDISASTLTPPATMPASSGINFTALNASNLGSGTVPTARLGTGTASSSVFLAGDNTWAAAGGGKINQVVGAEMTSDYTSTTSGAWLDTGLKVAITPSATDSKIYVQASVSSLYNTTSGYNTKVSIMQPVADSDSNAVFSTRDYNAQGPSAANTTYRAYSWGGIDSPSTTSAITYGVMINGESGGGTIGFNDAPAGGTDCFASITCWEILA